MPGCALNRIVFDPTLARIDVGNAILLNAIGLDSMGIVQHGTVFTWTSDNTNIATVTATGTVTGVKRGQCNITATSGSTSGSILVQVGRRDQ